MASCGILCPNLSDRISDNSNESRESTPSDPIGVLNEISLSGTPVISCRMDANVSMREDWGSGEGEVGAINSLFVLGAIQPLLYAPCTLEFCTRECSLEL